MSDAETPQGEREDYAPDWERTARKHIAVDVEMFGDDVRDSYTRLANGVYDEDATANDVLGVWRKATEMHERLTSEPLAALGTDLHPETVRVLTKLTRVEDGLLAVAGDVNRMRNGESPRRPGRIGQTADVLRDVADYLDELDEEVTPHDD